MGKNKLMIKILLNLKYKVFKKLNAFAHWLATGFLEITEDTLMDVLDKLESELLEDPPLPRRVELTEQISNYQTLLITKQKTKDDIDIACSEYQKKMDDYQI